MLLALNRSIASRAGTAEIELSRVNGATVATQCVATSPLKLLTPRQDTEAAWVYTSTYGGGLLGGDSIELDLVANPQTRCLLATQSSTKVYRSLEAPARQTLRADVRHDAVLLVAPDPLVCFAGSKYEQEQSFGLSATASLLLIDWFTSGRHARGERWAFERYRSRCEVLVDGRTVFRENLLLDPRDGELCEPTRMGACNCFATLLLVGPALSDAAERLMRGISQTPAPDESRVLCAASPIDRGLVVRLASEQTEAVAKWLRERLGDTFTSLIGRDPWDRKW